MTNAQLTRTIRERVAQVVDRLPIELTPKQQRMMETAVKEIVAQIAEDITKADNPQIDAMESELAEIRSLWKQINKILK